MSREEAAAKAIWNWHGQRAAMNTPEPTAEDRQVAMQALSAADAHDAAHGIHRTKTTRLPDEVGQWYASVTNGMVVESVMGMLTGERSEWFYAQNGPWIKIDLDCALEERLLDDATVERAAEAAALVDDYDGCFERVREWESREEWEREAHPESYPGSDYEDREWWIKRTRAVLAAAVEAGQ